MKLKSFRIENVKSIKDTGDVEVGPITLLVGRNNSGKSSVLKSIASIQNNTGVSAIENVRFGHNYSITTLKFENLSTSTFNATGGIIGTGELIAKANRNTSFELTLDINQGNHRQNVALFQSTEPLNYIYPYYSSRRVGGYAETVNESLTFDVRVDLSNIVSKVDRLSDNTHPDHEIFMELRDQVIGLPIAAISSGNGKRVGIWVNSTDRIWLDELGDGIVQMLGLVVHLCVAKNKLFLIEELENDIHPEALKILLGVIEKSSKDNQFIISTHNNIVLRHLGAVKSTKIHELTTTQTEEDGNRLQVTTIKPVGNTVSERINLLSNLGYELSDLDLHDGWLIFEESSAEKIVREFLIPWFVPELRSIKTVASRGAGDINRSFQALDKLVLFTHLESRYEGKVLVLADGDTAGIEAVEKLRQTYTSWPNEAFKNFEKPNFEAYYPSVFTGKIAAALSITDKKQKMEAKKALLDEVVVWIKEDEDRGKNELSKSAEQVIKLLSDFKQSVIG